MIIAKNKRFSLSINLDRPKKFAVYEKIYYGIGNDQSYLWVIATREYLCKSITRYFTARQIERARQLATQETKRWWREARAPRRWWR